MSRKAIPDRWQGGGNSEQTPARKDAMGQRISESFDELDRAIAVEISEVGARRFLRRRTMIRTVEAPIGSDDVELAVAVKVASGDAIPPACKQVES